MFIPDCKSGLLLAATCGCSRMTLLNHGQDALFCVEWCLSGCLRCSGLWEKGGHRSGESHDSCTGCKLYVEQHGFALLTFTWTECMSHESFILGCLLSVCQRGIDAWPLIAAVKVLALHSLCGEWCWQQSIFQKTKKPSVGRRLLISLESAPPLHISCNFLFFGQ